MQRVKTAAAELLKWQQDLEQWRLQMLGDRDRIRQEIMRETDARYREHIEKHGRLYQTEVALRIETEKQLAHRTPEEELICSS
ncbi:hypothetical protein AA0313_2341 [Acetobacter indonesiensis NRIC 0313]|nr:hypothetical protein AA0313_2341 [Acetobacter indonesiensis NRIC 0313]